jgi:hypothetical protein
VCEKERKKKEKKKKKKKKSLARHALDQTSTDYSLIY